MVTETVYHGAKANFPVEEIRAGSFFTNSYELASLFSGYFYSQGS